MFFNGVDVRTRAEVIITLAGLIPVPAPLTLLSFWTRCSWQILSVSSSAVSLAAASTASPLLRPFTSAALMAATSLDPHALKNKRSESLRGNSFILDRNSLSFSRTRRQPAFHLLRINTFQQFSQYLPSGTSFPSKVKPRTFLFFRRYTAASLLINSTQTKSWE